MQISKQLFCFIKNILYNNNTFISGNFQIKIMYEKALQDNLDKYKKKLSELSDRRMTIIKKYIKKLEDKKLEEVRKELKNNL